MSAAVRPRAASPHPGCRSSRSAGRSRPRSRAPGPAGRAPSCPSGSKMLNAIVPPRSSVPVRTEDLHERLTRWSAQGRERSRSASRWPRGRGRGSRRHADLLDRIEAEWSPPGSTAKLGVPSSNPAWPGLRRWASAATETIEMVPPANHGRSQFRQRVSAGDQRADAGGEAEHLVEAHAHEVRCRPRPGRARLVGTNAAASSSTRQPAFAGHARPARGGAAPPSSWTGRG